MTDFFSYSPLTLAVSRLYIVNTQEDVQTIPELGATKLLL